jgi:hypothetical protein
MVWRIGDGRSISIWEDKWLLSNTTHVVQSPVRILPKHAHVCELIDSDTNWWNIPLIEEIFNVEEASLICGMPICPRTQSSPGECGEEAKMVFTQFAVAII